MTARKHDRRGASTMGALLALGVLAAIGLGWWFTTREDVADAAFDPDRVVTVERGDLIDAVNANGRVEPVARVAVMSRASGIIKELLVEEGDAVTVGQVLAELDREQLDAQLAQDRADMNSAQARLDAARARVAEAEVAVRDPELEFLEREADRIDKLFAKGDVPLRDKEAADRALASARFRVDLVRASLPVLEATVSEAEANLEAAKASLERAETTLREATIRCPIEGVVLVRDTEVGDGVSSILTAGGNATQLMSLGDLSRMHVEARVDEVDLGRIHDEMPALVTVDAHRGKVLEGRIERIAPAGSVDTNGIVTFEVRVAVEDPDGILRPDMTSDVKLVIARKQGVLTLPQRAFSRDGEEWFVEKLTQSGETTAKERVRVELGLSDGLITEVGSGLTEGDRVLLPSRGGR